MRPVDEQKACIAIGLRTLPPGGLKGPVTIFFPHRMHGEPPMVAVLRREADELTMGGVQWDGRPFSLAPDEQTEKMIRAEIATAERRGLPLDPATGLPVLG